ncbi:rhodanese-like domain-containing protein [Winogradskyella sp. A3E31]|uniref:rhodanese-like domain-containing protein n=1 Tax=Winogradskyella sp. A3E31 TaxID=3349637 RepID=UPI00398B2134
MFKKINLLALVVVFALTSCLSNGNPAEVKVVTAEEMQDILELEDVQLVDVRTPDEFAAEHIENAQNIDFKSPTFEEDITKLDKDKPVVLYCKSGGRSAKCVKKLEEAGFKKIYDLKGGISKWKYATDTKEQGAP